MSGDWIKMRCDLSDDPAVIYIASVTNVTRDCVIGKLHRLWSWADRHTVDGETKLVGLNWIDEFLECAGIADALVKAGWLISNGDYLVFPNFERHNGCTAKRRLSAAERKARSRSGVTNVTQSCDSLFSYSSLDPSSSLEGGVGGEPPLERLPLTDKDKLALLTNYWAGDSKTFETDCEAAREYLQRKGEVLTADKAVGYMKVWHRNKQKFEKPPNAADKKKAWETEVVESWGGLTFEQMGEHE